MKQQISKLKETFVLLKENPSYLAVPVMIDIVFLFLVGFLGSYLASKSMPYFESFANINMAATAINTVDNSEMSGFLQQSAEKMMLSSKIMAVFAEVVFTVFILWIVFQGINWFLASKCVSKDTKFKKYFLNFSANSFLWFIANVIIWVFFINISFKNVVSSAGISQSLINLLFIALFLVWTYFLFVGYAISYKYSLMESLKKILVIGINDFKEIISAYIILVVLFLLANFLLRLFGSISFAALIISGIIIVLPLIAFARVYLVKVFESK